MNDPLERSVRIRCAVEHAFAVFTAKVDLWWPPGHRRFQSSRLSLEPRVGGRFLERSDSGEEYVFGEVQVCEPPHRIVYSWHPGAIDRPTEVEVRFTGDGDHTRIDVTHSEGDSGLGERWPDRCALFERGWGVALPALAAFAEQSDDVGQTGSA